MALQPHALTVFCGSSAGHDPRYAEAARAFGRAMVARGLDLVYGGGRLGMMGALADSVLAGGGRVHGVIPDFLVETEHAHHGVTALHVVASMHERKARMAELGGAFVALPGGLGTFEELFEVLTWSQLGIHPKPVGLLEVGGYFAPLEALLDRACADGFVRPADRARLLVAADPAALIELLATAPAPPSSVLRERG